MEGIQATFSVITCEATLPSETYDVQIESAPPGDYVFTGRYSLDELLQLVRRYFAPEAQWPGCERLREFDTVRIIKLSTTERYFSGTDPVSRPPRIGDVATICHELAPGNPNADVMVEMVNADGGTIWLAQFARDELVLVSRPSGTPAR